MKEHIAFESNALSGMVFGERIKLDIDGAPVEAVLAPWEEIRGLGITPQEGRPRLLGDGRMAVVFNRWDAATGTDLWLITYDSIETVLGTRLRNLDDLAQCFIGAVLTLRYSDGAEEAIHIWGIDKVFTRSVRFRATGGGVFLSKETMRSLLTQGRAVVPGDVAITIS